MILVCYNVFGLFVQHLSWSMEGGSKVSKHPVLYIYNIHVQFRSLELIRHLIFSEQYLSLLCFCCDIQLTCDRKK